MGKKHLVSSLKTVYETLFIVKKDRSLEGSGQASSVGDSVGDWIYPDAPDGTYHNLHLHVALSFPFDLEGEADSETDPPALRFKIIAGDYDIQEFSSTDFPGKEFNPDFQEFITMIPFDLILSQPQLLLKEEGFFEVPLGPGTTELQCPENLTCIAELKRDSR
jgi:hypothetical protein